MSKEKVFITGASGGIGIYLIPMLKDKYDLVLTDLEIENLKKWESECEIHQLDILDAESCQKYMQGAQFVLHLAANPSPAARFDECKEINIQGIYNIFESAKKSDVKRVIIASSVHAVNGYANDEQVKEDSPVRPSNIYGVTKVFAEGLASYFAYQEGIESIAIRIGGFNSIENDVNGGKELTLNQLTTYISPRDMGHLIERCLEVELERPFEIVHGISDNRFKFLDILDTREKLGYNPKDDAFEMVDVFSAFDGKIGLDSRS